MKEISNEPFMQQIPQKGRLLRMAEVKEIIPLSRSTIYRRIQEGSFPAPIKDGRCSLWVEIEIRAYAEKLLQQREPSKNQANRPTPA